MKISNIKKNSKSYSVFVLAIIILSGFILIVKSENVYAQYDCEFDPYLPGCPGYQEPCGDGECNRGVEDNPSSRLYCPSDCCNPPQQWSYNKRKCADSCGSLVGPAYNPYTNPTGTGLCASTYGDCWSAFPNGFEQLDSYDCTVCCKKRGTFPTELCGNGNIDSGEECDGTNLGSPPATCQTKGFTGGTIACYPRAGENKCKFDTRGCTGAPPPSGTGCGERGWRDPTFWGACSDCSGCGSAGCGEALAYCDGTNWNTNWNPLVPESQKSTATSGHVCPCRTSDRGSLCNEPKTSRISYGPYDLDPSKLQSEKQRAWRVSICMDTPSKSDPGNFKATMEAWVALYNSVFTPSVKRKPGGSDTTDAVSFPQSGLIDLIIGASGYSPTWAWQEITDGGGKCGVGPYVDNLENWDINKLNNCEKQSPKYKAGRVFSNFATVQITDEVIRKLREAGLNPTKISKDIINFDVEYEPGQNVGQVDVIRSVDDTTGIGQKWLWRPITDPLSGTPEITSIYPTTARIGTLLRINGKNLAGNVQFYDSSNKLFSYPGTSNPEFTQMTITIPSELVLGTYTVKISAAPDKISNGMTLTITEGARACSPDGSVCNYCAAESQCLVSVEANGTINCIDTNQYVEDNYCENREWTSRTRFLALNLLKMKSNDYILFCDNRENALNNLQYITESNEIVANVLTNLQTNNFCVLKAQDKIIAATSTNKNYEEVQGSLNIFGVTSCSNAKDDGKYASCSASNKVWYNKKLKSYIYSATPINVPSEALSVDSIRIPINAMIDVIKRVIIPNEQSLTPMRKFSRLYMVQQGSRTIIASIEGTNPSNAVIEYSGFDADICKFTDQYKNNLAVAQDLSRISCKKENNKYYVLVQGSQFTNLNPDSIWPDLTSKLRLR